MPSDDYVNLLEERVIALTKDNSELEIKVERLEKELETLKKEISLLKTNDINTNIFTNKIYS